jgi:imidazolonepropionase
MKRTKSSKILIKDIKALAIVEPKEVNRKAGKEMRNLNCIENAYLAVENDRIVDFGPMSNLQGITDWVNLEIIDAEGKYVLPAFVDSHTHLVFAKSRESEFVDRINGLTYEEIAKRGGGILNSAKAMSEASEDELFESSLTRLNDIISYGTGTVEIKSGYGLSVESELKMLRVIKRLKNASEVTVKATFLGAHAFPAEFKENHQGYIDLIINEMLPAIANEGLADYVDVFCERGYYSQEETRQVVEAAAKYGLKPKLHVNQFTNSGGLQLAIELGAISADHLEQMGEHEIKALLQSDTMPVSLPSCSYFLNLPYTPLREMIDSGLPVAIATDFNPGSTPSGNMQFLLSLAATKQKLLPAEALHAITLNAAAALELTDELGSIAIGKKANLILTKEIPSLDYMAYAFGTNHVEQMILNGKIMKL